MSCNGCRVLRKGCSDNCILRPCLQWIESAEAQGYATVFVAKFFGRVGLMSFISAVPENQRPGILVKCMLELWGQGYSYEELKTSVQTFPEEHKLPYLGVESTFRIVVDTFGKVLSSDEQRERIESFSYIPFKHPAEDISLALCNGKALTIFLGRVDLRNADNRFWLIETDDQFSNNGLPPTVQRTLFFGREVGGADRRLLPTFSLSNRKYLGPTAMDAEIAFLMANQALVQPGKLVYDPFVGTGSILVAASHFGAMTMGADIDIRVVRNGRGPDCNVWSNFKQYDLPLPISLIRADNNLPPWRGDLQEIFDAIICDPPYGVRAGGRKSGGRKLLKGVKGPYVIPEEKRKDHIPSTAPYSLVECVHDLLDVAARLLVMGGRLVFFYPVAVDEDAKDIFPDHKCFTLVSHSEQILSTRYSRCLLTMEKTARYTVDVAEMARKKHLEFRENHGMLTEESRDNGTLRSKVFSPADNLEVSSGLSEMNIKSDKDWKPKYRSKYV